MKNPAERFPELARLDALLQTCQSHGETDLDYLAHHYPRFCHTLSEFDHSWDRGRGLRVLDIGAHWLHQSLLWRRAGYDVTAMDLPLTLALPSVQALAAAEGIRLLEENDLERCPGLGRMPDNAFDIILFTEIIEHITFNPVHFWGEVHRILAPGGRIVITTPNYYYWAGRAWGIKRFMAGLGGGISIDEVLRTHTYGHHWREYSLREIIKYFCLLSPDFNTVKALAVRNYYPPPVQRMERFKQWLWEHIPRLRPNLHVEIELTGKQSGLQIAPDW